MTIKLFGFDVPFIVVALLAGMFGALVGMAGAGPIVCQVFCAAEESGVLLALVGVVLSYGAYRFVRVPAGAGRVVPA